MNSLFPTRLPYAETHYKFKLPWSPLYRRRPEIFVDGPSFAVPGVSPVFYLVLKDADFFPVRVRGLEISLSGSSPRPKQSISLDLDVSENLRFIPLPIDFGGCSGKVLINARIVLESSSGASTSFLNHGFPGIAPLPLEVTFLGAPLPYPEGWHAGEMHCHSDYSNDPVEYGAPLRVLQEAAHSLGMGFVLCTDHSYDFYYRKTSYMEATDPEANFAAYRAEALKLNGQSGLPIVIPGEEVSCGNSRGENVHLLVAGHEKFLPGLGDGGRRWFKNSPDLPIEAVLERLGATPSFAAHPRARVGAMERMIFRRGMWDEADLAGTGVRGLQFWNGHTGRDFQEGRAFWVQQLLAGKRLHPIGANDAHGDLNQNIGVKLPLISLYQGRNHVFGHVRTVVHAKEKSVAGIQEGLREGNLFSTDGPFLTLEAGGRARAASTPDFGPLRRVVVFAGKRGDSGETVVRDWNWDQGGPMDFSEGCTAPPGTHYLRAEARTRGNRLAIASPVYLQ